MLRYVEVMNDVVVTRLHRGSLKYPPGFFQYSPRIFLVRVVYD